MNKPRKKKMGRPLEAVPLRKLVKSVRQDIEKKLTERSSFEKSEERGNYKQK